jgi:predicted Zn-dependent protease
MKPVIILALLFTLVQAGEPPDSTALFRAANDELARSIQKLKIENQVKPYYISYRIEDTHQTEMRAGFGSVIYSNTNHRRDAYVSVRVGSYDMDNSNFICQTRSMNLIDSDQTSLPLEDDYYSIRQALWIVTDGTYKKALERFARKLATMQNQPRPDTVPDFARIEPTTSFTPIRAFEVDTNYWQEIICRTSAIFKNFPKIQESEVMFNASAVTKYFLDTEGNQSRSTQVLCMLEITAETQSKDGDPLEDRIGFYGLAPEDMPDLPEVLLAVQAMAETLSMQVSFDKEEDYSGPVIFVGQAAAELFFQILGKGVSDPKTPLFENEMLAQSAPSDLGMLAKRLGRRVMSNFLSAIDDPLMIRWYGTPLIGHYMIDDEGVPAQPVEVAIDGKLLSVLMSRTPTKRMPMTNGHGRYRDEDYGPRVIGLPSNLVITPNEQFRTEDLGAMLADICRDYDIPYGIVITRLMPTKTLTLKDHYMRYFQQMSGGGGEEGILSAPVTAYKIDAASHEVTLIRGLDFADVTPRVLRDIIAVGTEDYVYNFIYRDEYGNAYPMSVIAPPVLVEEMDLEGTDTKPTKLPILPHPYFKK